MYSLGRFCRLVYFRKGLEYINNEFSGNIPLDRNQLLSIPGTGPYICAAVRVFGYNVRDTIIDANVVRVLGRINGIPITPEIRRRKSFIALAERYVPEQKSVEYSYGILDFAAEICGAVNPKCDLCELSFVCKSPSC